ncbi:hypothetical protein ACOQFO_09455 [Ureibacillus sp. MALMAid1270]|uniref:hypothetical protein n=1 Tax=Ureibacillus sp. MALMAid1270 TaxID=3411629 RepID=UPI003BA723E7
MFISILIVGILILLFNGSYSYLLKVENPTSDLKIFVVKQEGMHNQHKQLTLKNQELKEGTNLYQNAIKVLRGNMDALNGEIEETNRVNESLKQKYLDIKDTHVCEKSVAQQFFILKY